MKTLILDDGWQTDETGRAYERCGDMTVSSAKFPDGMAAHVKRVQECGIKYMVWCAVPFVGYKNAVHERFRGKYLREQESVHCSVLDPRFPEVREYLAGMFERMLKEWGVDGFKFDYVGQLALLGDEKDPAIADNYAGRDTKSVPDAVDMLMTDVLARLRKIKSDVLIEYRQPYLGPAIRRYGNMIRAIDCPGEMQKNIVRTAMLRLTSGKTAVHSDMLEWNAGDSPERAAQSILASLFSTIQYSMVLSGLDDGHLRMMRHWIDFTQRHRKTLLDGDFTARFPQAHYPVLEASSDGERIVAVYLSGQVARVEMDRPAVVVNATGDASMVLDCSACADAVVRDTFGAKVGEMRLKEGLSRVDLPVSGYLELSRAAAD
jgi:alpha-galactosidase